MDQTEGYRHELKYQVDYGSYLALRSRLRPVMKHDFHTRPDGRYLIRSIYFDNGNDRALREKIDGVSLREKFRIRYYNDDLSLLFLEKKQKHGGLTKKLSTPITEEQCRALLGGDTSWMMESGEELLRELYCKMKGQGLRPRVLVSYLREPYVYPAGNVRVTFDSLLRTSLWSASFLEPSVGAPAMETPGEMVLEVKYDAFLPEIISDLLQMEGTRQEAFSKYGACRRFG